MPIDVKCPKCNRPLIASGNETDRRVICHRCRAEFLLPNSSTAKRSERTERVHPLVWTAIGGGSVAVAALIIGIALSKDNNNAPLGTPNNSAQPNVAKGSNDTPLADALRKIDTAKTTAADNGKIGQPKRFRSEELTNDGPDLAPDELFRRCSPAVVKIVVKNEAQKQIGTGSGFVIAKSEDSPQCLEIATNHHVIRGAVDVEVEFDNGEKRPALQVLAENDACDVAILVVQLPEKIPYELRFSTELPAVGKSVYAIGSPIGMKNTLSPGIANSLRKLDESGIEYLQTNAPISPGSSGGPLLNSRGLVVGITTLSMKSAQNLNFAVPNNVVQEVWRTRGLREVWRGASIDREYKQAIQALRTTLAAHGRPSSDPAMQFALTMGPQDDSAKRLATAQAARDSVPDGYKFLVELDLGEANYVVAYLKKLGDGLSAERMRNYVEYKRAISYYSSALQLNPKHARAWSSLAGCRLEGGEQIEALAAFNELVRLVPACSDAYRCRGECHLKMKRVDEAIEDFRSAVSLDPGSHFGQYSLGKAAREVGNLEEAANSLEKAIILAGEIPELVSDWIWLEELGETYFEMHNYRKALNAFQAASAKYKAQSGQTNLFLLTRIVKCEKLLSGQ